MCQDYIYDKDMEQIAKEEQRKAWKMQGMTALNTHIHNTHCGVHTIQNYDVSHECYSSWLKPHFTQNMEFTCFVTIILDIII